MKNTKGCRLGRGKSWMGQAEDSVLQVCQLTELKQTKERERYPNRFRSLYDKAKQDEGIKSNRESTLDPLFGNNSGMEAVVSSRPIHRVVS